MNEEDFWNVNAPYELFDNKKSLCEGILKHIQEKMLVQPIIVVYTCDPQTVKTFVK